MIKKTYKLKNKALIEKLKKYFRGLKGVSLAFLFGSFSRGAESALSDMDIAVYLENPELEDKIWLEVERIVKKEIDLVIINRAPPTVVWAALKDGIPLSVKNKALYLDLFLKISSEALDFIEFNLDFLNKREKAYGH